MEIDGAWEDDGVSEDSLEFDGVSEGLDGVLYASDSADALTRCDVSDRGIASGRTEFVGLVSGITYRQSEH